MTSYQEGRTYLFHRPILHSSQALRNTYRPFHHPTFEQIKNIVSIQLEQLNKRFMHRFTNAKRCFHLNMGHETPTFPPVVNSSAFPLKSRITFPVLTSKIFRTTLYIIKNVSQKGKDFSLGKKERKAMGRDLSVTNSYMCVSRIAGLVAAVCDQISLTRRKVNQFDLVQSHCQLEHQILGRI